MRITPKWQRKLITGLAAVPMLAATLQAQTTTVWNPAANPVSTGLWSEGANWTAGGVVPGAAYKAVFNVGSARACFVNSHAAPAQMVIGDGNAGSVVLVQGGSFTNVAGWTGLGYNSLANLEVQSGASAHFMDHLWVGFISGGVGTLTLNGGTAYIQGQLGLGWSGGRGEARINAGTLNLNQWSAAQTISGASTLDVRAGRVVINGDVTASIDAYVAEGKLTGYGGVGTVERVYDGTANKTTVTATRPDGAGGPYAASDWPTNINPNKIVHYYVTDGTLAAPNGNWVPTLGLKNDGDQATEDVTHGGLLGKRATAANLNIFDAAFADWNTNAFIDVLLQVYGDASVLNPGAGDRGRRIQFLTGTLPAAAGVYGGDYSTNAYNLKWNWVLFTITNHIINDGTGTNRQVGTIKTNATGDVTYGGINGGTIRLQGPDNNVNGLTVRAVAFGERGAFGYASDINQFAPADGSCPPVLDANLVGVDFNGVTNRLHVINDAASGQTVTFANDVGPANDKRRAVVPDYFLNFAIETNYLGAPCNENVTIKVCVDYYDDPAFANGSVFFGPESYATDEWGTLAICPASSWAALQGTGQWFRQSWVIAGVNLYGVSTAPQTGGPRFVSVNARVPVSRFEMAVIRNTGPLAGQDPLAGCYADPNICMGVYSDYVELDLAIGITNGLDVGTSGGDQVMVVEMAGPAHDLRLAVRPAQDNHLVNFQILTNAMGPTSQGNVHLAMVVTYYDDPAQAGKGFRPQVWKYQQVGSTAFNYMPEQHNIVLQGTDKWREAYWEIGVMSFDGVNQGPQAAARLDFQAPIYISRVRYAVIRPCGQNAGTNLLSGELPLSARLGADSLTQVSWPYRAPQAVLQSTPALGGTWALFTGTPAFDGGENIVYKFGATNGPAQFFRLFLTPP